MKKSKRFRCLFLCMVLLICSTCVVTSASASTPTYEQNVKDSNDMVFNFWDAFTDYETETYAPPEYFGGFSLDSNGKLIVYLTDNRQEIREAVTDICGSNDMTYESVDYSFNQLYALQNQMSAYYSAYHIVSSQPDLPRNKLIVYTDASPALLSMTLNGPMGRGIQNDMIEVRTYVPPVNNDLGAWSELSDEPTHELSSVASSSFYPGQYASIGSGGSNTGYGTVGFTATDSFGRKVLITHGHAYDDSNAYAIVGGMTFSVENYQICLLGSVHGLDAAYIALPANATISNKVNNNASKRITAVAHAVQMASYNGQAVEMFGWGHSGFFDGKAVLTDNYGSGYLLTITFDGEDGIQGGDSGGPIYLTGNSECRLLGIMETQSENRGVLWTDIAAAYRTITGAVLAPYTASN